MNTKAVITLGVAALSLVACIPSVNPYYQPSDITFDPRLIGEWGDDGESWKFERHSDEHAYELTLMENGEHRGSLKATLFALGDHEFLDLIAEGVRFDDDQSEIVNVSVFRGHLVLHVAEIEPELKMSFVDPDWLEDYLEENPRTLNHRIENGNVLLTGKTRELQRFLLKHVEGGNLFSGYGTLTRLRSSD